jgi:hypothetical protein
MNIESLRDYPSLQQIARSLWQGDVGQHGAAVLVGAGFSRNANYATADTPRPPLWNDLRAKMASLLYPGNPASAPSDPLRLAEEYRAFFGQAVLDHFIRDCICDAGWYPSKAHVRLLELPWSDVLTTNWDTLLERASKDVSSRNYSFVLSSKDLVHASAPRIVKLHGTVGASEPYIVAEEDYRTYPARQAAFVNLARQVFIENELCLIGFSGDDPNFLQWSGWVRDHLAESSRRIYLVGVLRLSAAKRKLLESRNVAPIDFTELVDSLSRDKQQSTATEAFLDYLEGARPAPSHAWAPRQLSSTETGSMEEILKRRQDRDLAAKELIQQARDWQSERECYPGWLVCPYGPRNALRWRCTEAIWKLRTAGDRLSGRDLETVLFELVWRFETSLTPLDDLLVGMVSKLTAENELSNFDSNQQRLLLTAVLRASREQGNSGRFAQFSGALEALAKSDPEARAELTYQRCLLLRERMDFSGLERNVDAVSGPDPVWNLRRAFILCELCRWDDAYASIRDALEEARKRARDQRNSLWARSRRAWAQWLAATPHSFRAPVAGEELSRDFSDEARSKCSPWDEIEALGTEVAEANRKRREEESKRFVPHFDPGTYSRSPNSVHFVSAVPITPDYTMRRVMEAVGIPFVIGDTRMLSFAADALRLEALQTTSWYLDLIRRVHSEDDPLRVQFFSRVSISTIPHDVVQDLVAVILAAISYWKQRIHGARLPAEANSSRDTLKSLVSALYHLTPRLDDTEATKCFKLALELGADRWLAHPLFMEVVHGLSKHSAGSMSFAARAQVALEAVEFPLPSEIGLAGPTVDYWRGPLFDLYRLDLRFSRDFAEPRWGARVRKLLQLASVPESRELATHQLAILVQTELLSAEERDEFGKVLWQQVDAGDFGLPTGTNLLGHMFAVLPAPPGVRNVERVSHRLYDNVSAIVGDATCLFAIATAGGRVQRTMLPTPLQAQELFDGILSHFLTLKEPEPTPWPSQGTTVEQLRRMAGLALATGVVPALNAQGRSVERGQRLLELTERGLVWSAIEALPDFAASVEELSLVIVDRICNGMVGLTFDEVGSSARAVERWQSLCRQGMAQAVPPRLLEVALSLLETRRDIALHEAIRCCRVLIEGSTGGEAFTGRVGRAFIPLIQEWQYAKVDPTERRAVSVSLVRAECALLARLLLQRQTEPAIDDWLETAKADPLPEVRFAAREGREPS